MHIVLKMKVFTNGCFDPLKPHHLKYLNEASKIGELIVGINSDKSVERIKKKPVESEKIRLNSIKFIVFVKEAYLFEEDTPIELIKKIKPDIYVKGGDYTIETINQELRKFLEESNIKIKFTKKYRK